MARQQLFRLGVLSVLAVKPFAIYAWAIFDLPCSHESILERRSYRAE
jgi:hypothetical protein